MNEQRIVPCPDCNTPMVLKKSKFKNPYFWSCPHFPACTGSHGAHPDGSPLGVPANKETKEWRIKAHEVFDTLWKCGGINMNRKKAYKLLAEKMGVKEVHISEQDIEGCKRVIVAAESLLPQKLNSKSDGEVG